MWRRKNFKVTFNFNTFSELKDLFYIYIYLHTHIYIYMIHINYLCKKEKQKICKCNNLKRS